MTMAAVVPFVLVAVGAAVGGFLAAAVLLRTERRARRYFVFGVLVGSMASTLVRRGRAARRVRSWRHMQRHLWSH
jgi:uncharacterized membrane protein YfcA